MRRESHQLPVSNPGRAVLLRRLSISIGTRDGVMEREHQEDDSSGEGDERENPGRRLGPDPIATNPIRVVRIPYRRRVQWSAQTKGTPMRHE